MIDDRYPHPKPERFRCQTPTSHRLRTGAFSRHHGLRQDTDQGIRRGKREYVFGVHNPRAGISLTGIYRTIQEEFCKISSDRDRSQGFARREKEGDDGATDRAIRSDHQVLNFQGYYQKGY